jgi:hypothetical protein
VVIKTRQAMRPLLSINAQAFKARPLTHFDAGLRTCCTVLSSRVTVALRLQHCLASYGADNDGFVQLSC